MDKDFPYRIRLKKISRSSFVDIKQIVDNPVFIELILKFMRNTVILNYEVSYSDYDMSPPTKTLLERIGDFCNDQPFGLWSFEASADEEDVSKFDRFYKTPYGETANMVKVVAKVYFENTHDSETFIKEFVILEKLST